MTISGLIILAFLIFHILHFTLGQVQPGYFSSMEPEGMRASRFNIRPLEA